MYSGTVFLDTVYIHYISVLFRNCVTLISRFRLWAVCVCVTVYTGVEPALVRTPQNIAITRSSQVTFDCSSNINTSYITWFSKLCETYGRPHDCPRIYNGFNNLENPPRFTVTSVNNATHVTRDLNIISTQLTDAGVYVCVENFPGRGVQQNSSAQLIVLGNTYFSIAS